MADVANLIIRVQSDQVNTADRRLRGMSTSGGAAEKATSGLMGAFTKFLGPLTAAVSVMGAFNKLISVQREFDVLNAGLITATGSSEKAAVAFEALNDFATKTPYGLQQAVEGFTKLVNLGLEPSERALMSYGNTASAMGKDLNQMIEAVADAATGEFERLKEFGIKAKQEGDKVSLTFRGTTTTIGNNAKEIEGYLMALGENEFAGAMETRMNSLDGAIAGLGDAWDGLWRTISQQGIGDSIAEAVNVAANALQELTDMIASGEMEGYLKAILIAFRDWGTDIKTTVDLITTWFVDTFGEWKDEGMAVVDFLIDAFKQFPQNVRALIQILVVEFLSGFNAIRAYATAFADGIRAIFSDDTFANVGARLQGELNGIARAREDSLTQIMGERDATINAVDDQIAATRKLRKEYDDAAAARRAAGGDRLAQFRVGGDGKPASDKVDKAAARAAEAAKKKREQEFKATIESLQTEEEAIQASYEKRAKIIRENTDPASDQRKQLMERLEKERAVELAKLGESRNSEVESLRQSLLTQEESIKESYQRRIDLINNNTQAGSEIQRRMTDEVTKARDKELADLARQRQASVDSLYNGLLKEEEALQRSYDRKKELILTNEEVTELERQDLLKRLKQQFDNETAEMENKRIQTQLQTGEQLFNGLAGLAKSYAGEQSTAYRALFAVSKAFSVAQAAMSIATGIAKAQELGFPANLAEMARVAATGAGILAQINGAQFSGAYDQGGQIPAGKIGIVGEYGPEFVRGPAAVTGRQMTARQQQSADTASAEPAAAPVVNLRQINAFDTGVIGDYLSTGEGEELLMNVVRRNRTTIKNMAAGG